MIGTGIGLGLGLPLDLLLLAPAPVAPPPTPITDATPLAATVELWPGARWTIERTSDVARPILVVEPGSDHVVRVRSITRLIEGDPATPASVRVQLVWGGATVLDTVVSATTAPTGPSYRLAISRSLFTAAPGDRRLRVVLTADDGSVTTLEYTLLTVG